MNTCRDLNSEVDTKVFLSGLKYYHHGISERYLDRLCDLPSYDHMKDLPNTKFEPTKEILPTNRGTMLYMRLAKYSCITDDSARLRVFVKDQYRTMLVAYILIMLWSCYMRVLERVYEQIGLQFRPYRTPFAPITKPLWRRIAVREYSPLNFGRETLLR